ncbi:SFRICE_000647 [Gryllus bimaculatus]|nr:SFRICE_000647 [Gryllus bimaculatus]
MFKGKRKLASNCFNLRGSYTCSCREGLADVSPNRAFPGRLCSAAPLGCARCGFHGACDDASGGCRCFQWYAGDACQINLKVLLIALVTLGSALLLLLAAAAAGVVLVRGARARAAGATAGRASARPPRPPAFLRARAARRRGRATSAP